MVSLESRSKPKPGETMAAAAGLLGGIGFLERLDELFLEFRNVTIKLDMNIY